jgi:hypothetical protein
VAVGAEPAVAQAGTGGAARCGDAGGDACFWLVVWLRSARTR